MLIQKNGKNDKEQYMGVKFQVIQTKCPIPKKHLDAFLKLDKATGSFLNPESNEGNLSIRFSDEFLIKRAGAKITECEAKDVILVSDIQDAQVFASGGTPSSESVMHEAIYKEREDAQVVLHFHSPELLKRDGFAEVGPFPYGSNELAEAVGEEAKKTDIIKIIEHGLVLIAKDVCSLLFGLEMLMR
jgi:ribulose-5-phosphate 4-epimerase/fuculose-1-phosphate aldolase